MSKGVVVHSHEVKPFVCDQTYSSKMLLDDIVAGGRSIHMNEGTLKGGCSTPGTTHEATEIYYIIKGEAVLTLGKMGRIGGCRVRGESDEKITLNNCTIEF